MSLNPLNVLKRKLDDETIPLPKRLRLAKNVVLTHHFPAAPKERIVSDWLETNLKGNKINGEDFRSVLGWLNTIEDATVELKSKFIELTSQYLQINKLQDEDVPYILSFIENNKIAPQLSTHIEEYCFVIKTLLKHLQTDLNVENISSAKRIFNGLVKYYKESKKKLVIIDKILEGDNLETIFDYLDTAECREVVLNVCQTILFPMSKKSFFTIYLRTLLQKETTEELMEEKGDNIQAVLKTMDAFFTFPSGRTSNDEGFLKKFIEAFVTSFKTESQLIFAFYIMVSTSLNVEQSYINPAMKMPTIQFEQKKDDKIKRNLLLNMLEFLLQNEVDLTTRLTETLSGNKGHIKKKFTSFLQAFIMTQLKLEGKPDKTTLEIIITSLKLDPTLVESKLDQILPPLMVAKKQKKLSETYVSMLNCLLEILFKLSRGVTFVTQILPHLKSSLEAIDGEQQLLVKMLRSDNENDDVVSEVVVGADLFPRECVEVFGKLTSELMFRQNGELLLSLQKDFEDYCLVKLEEGNCAPSTSTLAQAMAAILSSFFTRNKMAEHTVPQLIAEEFWTMFGSFEREVLGRLGESLLKIEQDPNLIRAFFELSLSYAQLKLLNLQYSNVKVALPRIEGTLPVFDLHFLLPCLSSEQWTALCEKVGGFSSRDMVLTNLLILKMTAVELLSLQDDEYNAQELNSATKSYLIKNTYRDGLSLTNNIELDKNTILNKVVFTNLDPGQLKKLAKNLISHDFLETTENVLQTDAISSNKHLLNALAIETLRTIAQSLESTMEANQYQNLSKALNKQTFEMANFLTETKNVKEFFELYSQSRECSDGDLAKHLELLRHLQLPYLEENYQLTAIFILLAMKNAAESKKIRKGVDQLLQSIFEISPKHPDLYKLFPIEYIFDFEGQYLIKLLTLTIKTSNPLLLIKCLLETAVKKVKTNAEVVKILVKILLTNQKVKKEDATNIEYFSDVVFQISCLILPIIAKEKKAITNSAFRTILAELQEKLHKALLKSFKSINLHNEKSQFLQKAGNPEDSETVIENTMATLNAMEAFSLTLSKYCETTDAEDIKNLDYLWSGLEFFVENAITAIQNADSKSHHVDSSVHLLNVTLRNIKKLETHTIFQTRDKTFVKIWQSVKARLLIIFEGRSSKDQKKSVNDACLEDIGVTVKFLSELSSVDGFIGNFIGDLFNLMILKKPSTKTQDDLCQLTSHQVAKYLWSSCLRANIIERKCLAMSKTIYRSCKNMSQWLRQHYEQREVVKSVGESEELVKIEDKVCEVLKVDLDVLAEVILAAKKIPLNYKFLDAIFEAQHLIQFVMGLKSMRIRCEVSWQSYFKLFEGSMSILNSLLMSREELLEDRWPCYLQCYRSLVDSLCQKSSAQTQLDRQTEEHLAVIGHSMEKLTQSITKRKAHISRLAAYTVADICAWLEKTGPSKLVRQHLENSVALLIQVSDSSYAMAFLRRALAGAPGQITMTNMYSMYKRYHKYVGNA